MLILLIDVQLFMHAYILIYDDLYLTDLISPPSVLVHSGGVHGGHYYAFIRPTLSDQWYVLMSKLFTCL